MNDKTSFFDKAKANFKRVSQSIITYRVLLLTYALTLLTGMIAGAFIF